MTAFDHKTHSFVDNGLKKWAISGEIGHIRVKNSFIVIASSTGTVARYNIATGHVFPQDKAVQILKADSSIVSLAMDELNNEGLLGTDKGALYYLNFNEKVIIKIVNKANSIQDEISIVKFNEHNP